MEGLRGVVESAGGLVVLGVFLGGSGERGVVGTGVLGVLTPGLVSLLPLAEPSDDLILPSSSGVISPSNSSGTI